MPKRSADGAGRTSSKKGGGVIKSDAKYASEGKPGRRRKKRPCRLDTSLIDEDSCDSPPALPSPLAACGQCSYKAVTTAELEQHALAAHYGLARAAGLSQEFNKRERIQAFRASMKAGYALCCPRCDKSFKSAEGMSGHMETCGVEVQPIECPVCGKYMQQISMRVHMRWHEKQAAEGKQREVDDAPSNSTLAMWKREVRRVNMASCQFPGCRFKAATVDAMCRHFSDCPSRPTKCRVLQCSKCPTLEFRDPAALQLHVQQKHPDVERRQSSSSRRSVASDSAATSEYVAVVNQKVIGQLTYFTPTERMECVRAELQRYRNWLAKVPPMNLTRSSRRGPSAGWSRSCADRRRRHAPRVQLSPAFSVRALSDVVDGRTRGGGDAGADADVGVFASWERIDLFQCEESGASGDLCGSHGSLLAFCGGPVTALDWCPRPSSSDGDADILYLALSCRAVDDNDAADGSFAALSTLPPNHLTSQPTAVQVWSIGGDLFAGELAYCACVDGGPVWDLKWCPNFSTGASVGSLGRIAAACGDGRVRIYELPHSSELLDTIDSGSPAGAPQHRYFNKTPDLQLAIFECPQPAPCVRVQWSMSDAGRTLMAGFGDGTVAVWNVDSASPLLCDIDPDSGGKVLYPIQTFWAHHGQVAGLAVSPYSSRFAFTTGRDRQQHVWDLEEPTRSTRSQFKNRPAGSDMCWPSGVKKVMVGFDHSLWSGSPSVVLLDAAGPVADQPLFTHVAKCCSLAVNDNTLGLATGTESGVVSLAHWRHLLATKNKFNWRHMVMRADVEPIQRADEHESSNTADGQLRLRRLGDTYTEMWKSCAVVFGDAGRSSVPLDENLSAHGAWVTHYPFVSVNRVAWSANSETQPDLLAAGLECGFLRVMHAPSAFFARSH